MSPELEAAVDAYDYARCTLYGRNEKPMSDVNKETIAPMIEAAIKAYLAAVKHEPR